MDYEIHFDSRTAPESIANALVQRYGIPSERILTADQVAFSSGRWPMALIIPAPAGDEHFACVLEAGDELADAIGHISERELTTVLCRAIGTRAIILDGRPGYDTWLLVGPDGTHHSVTVDKAAVEEGNFVITATSPIPQIASDKRARGSRPLAL